MITRAIKRWLNRMFAWWPWKSSVKAAYMPAPGNMKTGLPQEMTLRTTTDGPLSQPGVAPIAVEQGHEGHPPEVTPAFSEDSTHPDEPPSQSGEKLSNHILQETAPSTPLPMSETTPPSPTTEQQLRFLRYLVVHGIINEGFSEGQVPRQYKRDS